MELKYRGLSYTQKQSEIAAKETGIKAKFLGQTYLVRRSIHSILARSASNLKYRGIMY